MKYDAKNGSLKLDEHIRKRSRYKIKVITIIVVISIFIFFFYPIDLEHSADIKNLTADYISSISLNQTIQIPKGMDIDKKKISMYDIAEELEELKPLPLSVHSESYLISMENITDESFIEEVLLILSDHNMRKRYFSRKVDTFHIDHTMPRLTTILICLNDSNKTQIDISISHDPRYVSVYKISDTNGSGDRARYKIYGDGIDTQKLFELTREF